MIDNRNLQDIAQEFGINEEARYPYPVYGWDAVKMANNLNLEQLNQIRLAVENDPSNRNVSGSFNIYTKSAQRKLDTLAWAVTYILKQKKSQA